MNSFRFAFVILVISFLTTQSFAATKFDQVKDLYQKAAAPASETDLFVQIAKIETCWQFSPEFPEMSTTYLTPVTGLFAIPGDGPAIPDRPFTGIVFSEDSHTPVTYEFQKYEAALNSDGYLIRYNYRAVSETALSTTFRTVTGSASFRVSESYVHYSQSKGSYGYCSLKK